jgi:hypothetical protein
MRTLVLSDLKLGLADLLDQRAAGLAGTSAGTLYRPHLERVRRAIDALPRSVAKERPLTEELARTDVEHDDFGAALWHYTEAFLRAPGLDAETRRGAQRIRAELIPSLAVLRVSYASEAAAAKERRPHLVALRSELERFPLPGRQTLLAWAEGFVDRGEALLPLLTERARLIAEQDSSTRARAGMLRSEAISVLLRLRAALSDEFADRPAIARDRDRELFAFIDRLAEARTAALRGRGTASGRGSDAAPSELDADPAAADGDGVPPQVS